MAIPMMKATYTLDPDAIRALEGLARRLGVSKSEALRRAIHAAADTGARDERIAALDRLQELMGLTPAAASAWARSVRAERSADDRISRLHAGTVDAGTRGHGTAGHGTVDAAAPRVRRVAEPAPRRRQ